MAREQLGICAEANLHGCYLLCNALDGQEALLRHRLSRIPQLLSRLSDHFSEAMLTAVVAVSSHYWDTLYPWQRPIGLQAFPEFSSEHVAVSYTTADLLIHIRSDRADVNYIALQQIYQLIVQSVEVVEELISFRYLDGRQLTGFTDLPVNPRGLLRRKAALINANDSPLFAGGSYLHFYRQMLDQRQWLQLSLEQQEDIMGYQKVDGKPLAEMLYNEKSHLACCAMSNLAAEPKLVQQNMPFASLRAQGALQLHFSAVPEAFTEQWRQRLGVNENHIYDSLLNYCQVDLAAAFFVPSVSYIEAAARGDFNHLKQSGEQ